MSGRAAVEGPFTSGMQSTLGRIPNYCDRQILFITFGQVIHEMVCAKFDADWSKTLEGVCKSRFYTFCDVAKKTLAKMGGAYVR